MYFASIARAEPSIYKKFDQNTQALKNFRTTQFFRGEKKCKSKEVEGTHSWNAWGTRDRESKTKKKSKCCEHIFEGIFNFIANMSSVFLQSLN